MKAKTRRNALKSHDVLLAPATRDALALYALLKCASFMRPRGWRIKLGAASSFACSPLTKCDILNFTRVMNSQAHILTLIITIISCRLWCELSLITAAKKKEKCNWLLAAPRVRRPAKYATQIGH